jgi:hypothetical protein
MKSTPSSTFVSRLRPLSILDLERMTPARLQLRQTKKRRSARQLCRSWRLPLDLARRFVLAQANENSVTKKAIIRPTQIGDFGDQFGPEPLGRPSGRRIFSEAACATLRSLTKTILASF